MSDDLELYDIRLKDAADLTDEEKAVLRENEDELTDEEKEEFKDALVVEPESRKKDEEFKFKNQEELDAYFEKKFSEKLAAKKDEEEEPRGDEEEPKGEEEFKIDMELPAD